MSITAGSSGGNSRKPFAVPPIKVACLSCRASRTRCNGSNPCATCHDRNRECIYTPSKRGGARMRKKAQHVVDNVQQRAQTHVEVTHQDPSDQPIHFRTMIDPGAGLKRLNDLSQDSDFIFDALFASAISDDSSTHVGFEPSEPQPSVPIVRTYKTEKAILDAYYIFIHPFFPILPPPVTTPTDQAVPHFQNHSDCFEDEFEPSTPISLAISAILTLIPCHNDVNHEEQDSVLFRRQYAQYLAQCAIEGIEIETEIPQSSIEPSKALNETSNNDYRCPFHPKVPIELESIIALDILSVYEYAQRGNLKKMQIRAGQALMAAMALSIHTSSEEEDFSEAKRRVWWMTYVCVCQGAIVSNSEPTFSMFTSSFTSKYPVLQSDNEAFSIFIQAQQAILAATQFVIQLNKTVKSNGNMSRIYERMNDLEMHLSSLGAVADKWILQSTPTSPLDSSEAVVSRSLRCMARIKLNSARIKVHRYCAFVDLPVFSSRHCDLKSKADQDKPSESRIWPACSCSSLISSSPPMSMTDGSSARSTVSENRTPSSDYHLLNQAASSSFSSLESAKICLKSALNIAQSFEDLPYPNPSGQFSSSPCHLSTTSKTICPRTMPSFACCAMQCAYALLMVNHKTRAKYSGNELNSPMVESLLARLRSGLMSISTTLENYAIAFEALGGMRDQIQGAIDPSRISDNSVEE